MRRTHASERRATRRAGGTEEEDLYATHARLGEACDSLLGVLEVQPAPAVKILAVAVTSL
jgi:hypothetical protein